MPWPWKALDAIEARLGFLHPREWESVDRPGRSPRPPPPERSKLEATCRALLWTLLAVVVVGSAVYLAILNR